MGRRKGSTNKKRALAQPVNYEVETKEPEIVIAAETPTENPDTGNTGDVAEPATVETDSQQDYKEILNSFDQIVDAAKEKAANETPAPDAKRTRRTKADIAQEKIKLPGRMFALGVDRLTANLMCIVDSATNKQPETIIPAHWFYADDKALDELAPLAAESAAELGIDRYPTVTMFGIIISNQLSKFMQLKAVIRQEKRRNPDFDIADLEDKQK